MALAVETPAREDLSFRSNDDKRIGARWYKSDATTPVVITTAAVTFQFDPPEIVYDPDTGEPLPAPPLEEHRIDSTTPGDPNGWIDATSLAQGIVLAQVPHAIWAGFTATTGRWDLIATGESMQRCLVRGCFQVEDGVS